MTWKDVRCTLCLKVPSMLVSGRSPRISERGAAYRCGLMAVVMKGTGPMTAPMGMAA